MICGINCDLEEKRQVKKESLEEYGLKKKIPVFEVSLKTGTNVNETFQKLVNLILENRSEEELIKEFGIKKGQSLNIEKTNKNNKKNGCTKSK